MGHLSPSKLVSLLFYAEFSLFLCEKKRKEQLAFIFNWFIRSLIFTDYCFWEERSVAISFVASSNERKICSVCFSATNLIIFSLRIHTYIRCPIKFGSSIVHPLSATTFIYRLPVRSCRSEVGDVGKERNHLLMPRLKPKVDATLNQSLSAKEEKETTSCYFLDFSYFI